MWGWTDHRPTFMPESVGSPTQVGRGWRANNNMLDTDAYGRGPARTV